MNKLIYVTIIWFGVAGGISGASINMVSDRCGHITSTAATSLIESSLWWPITVIAALVMNSDIDLKPSPCEEL